MLSPSVQIKHLVSPKNKFHSGDPAGDPCYANPTRSIQHMYLYPINFTCGIKVLSYAPNSPDDN